MHHIGIGAEHARTPVLKLVDDHHVRIVNAATGELLLVLTIDPTRNYQPLGLWPGPQPGKHRRPDPVVGPAGPGSRARSQGGAEGIRTPDLLIANETRYQLRHSTVAPRDQDARRTGRRGLEDLRRRRGIRIEDGTRRAGPDASAQLPTARSRCCSGGGGARWRPRPPAALSAALRPELRRPPARAGRWCGPSGAHDGLVTYVGSVTGSGSHKPSADRTLDLDGGDPDRDRRGVHVVETAEDLPRAEPRGTVIPGSEARQVAHHDRGRGSRRRESGGKSVVTGAPAWPRGRPRHSQARCSRRTSTRARARNATITATGNGRGPGLEEAGHRADTDTGGDHQEKTQTDESTLGRGSRRRCGGLRWVVAEWGASVPLEAAGRPSTGAAAPTGLPEGGPRRHDGSRGLVDGLRGHGGRRTTQAGRAPRGGTRAWSRPRHGPPRGGRGRWCQRHGFSPPRHGDAGPSGSGTTAQTAARATKIRPDKSTGPQLKSAGPFPDAHDVRCVGRQLM